VVCLAWKTTNLWPQQQHHRPLQSIALEGLLINTPLKGKGKKCTLYLHHGPCEGVTNYHKSQEAKPEDGGEEAEREKDKEDGEEGSAERSQREPYHLYQSLALSSKLRPDLAPLKVAPQKRASPNDRLDLKERVITLLATEEKELFEAWVTSINRNISLCNSRNRPKGHATQLSN